MARMPDMTFTQANRVGGPFAAGMPIGLVLHRTESPYNQVLRTMTQGPNPRGKSAHFLVGKQDSQVVQLVDTNTVAHHVGPGANQLYLGIEFESITARLGIHGQDPLTNLDNLTPFQIDIGRDIVNWICRMHNIPKNGPPTSQQWANCGGRWNGILGHADVSRGGFFHTDHGDELQFLDYIALEIWP